MELRTKEMRERDEQREKRKYRFTVLRIRIPSIAETNQYILQGVFYSTAQFSEVRAWVNDSLGEEALASVWNLWDPATRKNVDSDDACLCDISLCPAAILVLRFGDYVPKTVLKAELLENVEEL